MLSEGLGRSRSSASIRSRTWEVISSVVKGMIGLRSGCAGAPAPLGVPFGAPFAGPAGRGTRPSKRPWSKEPADATGAPISSSAFDQRRQSAPAPMKGLYPP